MSSSSGTSSSSQQIQNNGSEGGDLLKAIDQRKRKRMESNRESARRSRMRKQKRLDDLTAEIAQLNKENSQILTNISATTQHYVNLESENSILRAQMMELSQRLHSLNEILDFISCSTSAPSATRGSCLFEADEFQHLGFADSFLNIAWNSMGLTQQPLMSTVELFDH
ncbi:Basic leucine-zipper 44 [Dorcoceras hygrometricum]|uniref:Basic leucine-zipper 44 n=1 Tax=Dorcoceras hygrometricum TaxID=472368 RepID=A0A2Z7B5B7_9LAMI|nr:Basic leucine-zipper 44 [Dorcoceras hygrometricum]